VAENPGRFTQLVTPLAAALAGAGIAHVVRRRWVPGARMAVRPAILAILLALLSIVWFWPAQIHNPLATARWSWMFAPLPDYLQEPYRPALRPDDVVLTTDPTQAAALLGVPTVMLPLDGPRAARDAALRFHARYLLEVDGSQWFRFRGPGGD